MLFNILSFDNPSLRTRLDFNNIIILTFVNKSRRVLTPVLIFADFRNFIFMQ